MCLLYKLSDFLLFSFIVHGLKKNFTFTFCTDHLAWPVTLGIFLILKELPACLVTLGIFVIF